MTAPTPDTSPGDEIDEVLENMFMVGVQHGSRTIPEIDKLQAEAKDRLNRLMLTRVRDELQEVLNYIPPSTSGQPDLVRVSQIMYAMNRIKAIDAQLNKEETDGDVPTTEEPSKP